MSNTPPHKESFYQAKIIRWLKEQYPGAFVWKAQAGPYCRQGIPDICAIINGHFSDLRSSARRSGGSPKSKSRPSRKSMPPGESPPLCPTRSRSRRSSGRREYN